MTREELEGIRTDRCGLDIANDDSVLALVESTIKRWKVPATSATATPVGGIASYHEPTVMLARALLDARAKLRRHMTADYRVKP